MNQVKGQHIFPSDQVLQLVQGDITLEDVDAIVNAANAHLIHGAGVAGAIVRRGGEQIQRESDQWVKEHGLVSHAKPAYTRAGDLPARYVIHAVGPVWGEGDEDENLSSAISGSLELANSLELTSLAFPAISTGIFGFPKERAAKIILETIAEYFNKYPKSTIKVVRLTLFDQETVNVFIDQWSQLGYSWYPSNLQPDDHLNP